MWYEINVARIGPNGEYIHYFGTAKRSILEKRVALEMFETFKLAFPAPQYEVTLWEEHRGGVRIL